MSDDPTLPEQHTDGDSLDDELTLDRPPQDDGLDEQSAHDNQDNNRLSPGTIGAGDDTAEEEADETSTHVPPTD